MRRLFAVLCLTLLWCTGCASAVPSHSAQEWDLITQMFDAMKTEVDSLHIAVRDIQAVVADLQDALRASSGLPTPATGTAGETTGNAPSHAKARQGFDDPSTSAQQCAAITKKGTRCSRRAQPGSLYCWQHQGQQSAVDSPGAGTPSVESDAGRTICTGPRGGKYYINSHGKKTYVRHR